MSESVVLPALGESVTEGTVTRWLKQVGERVEVDEPLVEVSTDKVDTEIPSPVAGVLEQILVAEDETVEVGAPLALIGDGSGGGAAAAPAETAAAPAAAPVSPPAAEPVAAPVAAAAPPAVDEGPLPTPAATPPAAAPAVPPVPAPDAPAAPAAPASAAPADAAAQNEPYTTPLVRQLARTLNVDLSLIKGTGVGGRIRKEDVQAAAASVPAAAPSQAAAPQAAVAAPEVSALRGTSIKLSRLRSIIAAKAVESMQNTAQLSTVIEVDVTKLSEYRESVKDDFYAANGIKLTFLPFVVEAATRALQAYPIINSSLQDDQIVCPPYENISIAVDTERGLLTPVVKEAGDKSVTQLAQSIADLAKRTRDNTLTPDELFGGTFTVTNTGSRGALFDTPVVFLPQLAILGVGVVTKRAVVVKAADGQDTIAIRSMMYLVLSYDHRIIDGADAARFLGTVKNRLENGPFQL